MDITLIIMGGVLLFVTLLFSSLYLGARSQGFVVPNGYLPPETILHFPLNSQLVCPGNVEKEIVEIDGVVIEGAHQAALLRCTVEGEPVVMAVIYWDGEADASRFWVTYYRAVSRYHMRKRAFRNNLWKPKFVVGRFGGSAPFDLSAWHQGNWFFQVNVSAKIKDSHALKGALTDQMLAYMKKHSL